VQPYLGFTEISRFFGMHMQAIGAAVDLRDSCLHQRYELVVKPAFLKIRFNAGEGSNAIGRNGERVQPLGHDINSV
jgi:hypothetical protein